MLLQWLVLNRRGVIVYNVELGTSICPRVSACSCLTRSGWRERMQCPAGTQSRHSSVSDFSFPLGMAAVLGPGLQQEGDLTPLLPIILPPEKPLGNCHNFTAPRMLGRLGKCTSFKYADSLSKEQHLQGYLMRAKGQGAMCRENYHYPGCSEQGDCALRAAK